MMIHQKYSFFLLLILPPVIIMGIALLLTFIPLPAPLSQAGSHSRNLMAAILTGILGMAWVITLTVFVINAFLSSGRKLESTFTAWGLTASNYQGLGRQYRGRIDRRQVEAQFTPGSMLQNSLLNIRIETANRQRMVIGMSQPLLDCSDCQRVEFSSFPSGSIQVFAEDPGWAQKFLGEPSNTDLIKRLMDETEGLGSWEIYLQPGILWYHARPTPEFDTTHLNIRLQILLDLASATEKTN